MTVSFCEKGNFGTGTAKGSKFVSEAPEKASAWVKGIAERQELDRRADFGLC